MLKKNRISDIKAHSQEWHTARLAKFTSSDAVKLIGNGFMTYIRDKVGEELTGVSSSSSVDTEDTRHGILYEPEAIRKAGQKLGVDFVITQQLVTNPENRCGCTPDFMIPIRESPDGTEWEVETGEVKCPSTNANYISVFECETFFEIKKVAPKWYWQCLDQMDNCESLRHHFVIYQPFFKSGNLKVWSFKKNDPLEVNGKKTYPIFEDLKILRAKKAEALEKFDQVRSKLLSAGYF